MARVSSDGAPQAARKPQYGAPWQVVEYVDTDAVGSVRVVTDAQGQVVARHDFLPFGEELAPASPPRETRLFTGQERDVETGQDYFGARQLRTDLGRFLAPDPLTLVPRVVGAQGINSYVYVRNNPLRLIDPNGLDARALQNQPLEYGCPSLDDLPNFDPLGETEFQRQPQVEVSKEKYTTADAAAEAALDYYYQMSMDENREYGGRIVQYGPNEFRYTTAVRALPSKPWEVDVDDGMGNGKRIPAGTTSAGFYHTHPQILGRDPWTFSRSDLMYEPCRAYVIRPDRSILKWEMARTRSPYWDDAAKQFVLRQGPYM